VDAEAEPIQYIPFYALDRLLSESSPYWLLSQNGFVELRSPKRFTLGADGRAELALLFLPAKIELEVRTNSRR
jgi:hypothetical protein